MKPVDICCRERMSVKSDQIQMDDNPNPQHYNSGFQSTTLFLIVAAVVICASFIITSLVAIQDVRSNPAIRPGEIWLNEATSHLAILILLPLFPMIIRRIFSHRLLDWRALFFLFAGYIAFVFLHLAIMMVVRKLLHPAILGFGYSPNLLAPAHLVYESGKDLLTYTVLMISAVAFIKIQLHRSTKAELQSPNSDIEPIVLRSGASVRYVSPNEIVSGSASGNYVEVRLQNGTFLARSSLQEMINLISPRSDRFRRVHRSHFVNLDKVTGVEPVGDGRVYIDLSDGSRLTGSRSYKAYIDDWSRAASRGIE